MQQAKLGVVGAGGVLFGPSGIVELRFAGSLGRASNNKQRIMPYFKEFRSPMRNTSSILNILSDSKNKIRSFNQGSSLKDEQLGSIVRQIRYTLKSIPRVSIFHIL